MAGGLDRANEYARGTLGKGVFAGGGSIGLGRDPDQKRSCGAVNSGKFENGGSDYVRSEGGGARAGHELWSGAVSEWVNVRWRLRIKVRRRESQVTTTGMKSPRFLVF